MKEKIATDDLFKILRDKHEINNYLDKNQEQLLNEPLSDYLNKIAAGKSLKRSEIMEKAYLTKSYLYKLFDGEKTNPSRDILIQLYFGFSFTLEETQEFLKKTGGGVLYPRKTRDSVIIFCLQRGATIIDCNELLQETGERILGES